MKTDLSFLVKNVPTQFKSLSFIISNNIPLDIGTGDKLEWAPNQMDSLFPMTNAPIVALSGGDNLGALLWAFTLYNGVFTTIGKPGNWMLPALAYLLRQENETWFLDFKVGYSFQAPPIVDAIRFGFFLFLGVLANRFVINSFDGDGYWGWSTGICLALPSILINISRDKLKSRDETYFQDQLYQDVSVFISKRIEKLKVNPKKFENQSIKTDTIKSSLTEERLLNAFRQYSPEYRSKETVSDKVLKKALRQTLRLKPDKNGFYKGIQLLDMDIDVKIALEQSLERTRREKAEAEALKKVSVLTSASLEESEAVNVDRGGSTSGDEFVR